MTLLPELEPDRQPWPRCDECKDPIRWWPLRLVVAAFFLIFQGAPAVLLPAVRVGALRGPDAGPFS